MDKGVLDPGLLCAVPGVSVGEDMVAGMPIAFVRGRQMGVRIADGKLDFDRLFAAVEDLKKRFGLESLEVASKHGHVEIVTQRDERGGLVQRRAFLSFLREGLESFLPTKIIVPEIAFKLADSVAKVAPNLKATSRFGIIRTEIPQSQLSVRLGDEDLSRLQLAASYQDLELRSAMGGNISVICDLALASEPTEMRAKLNIFLTKNILPLLRSPS